jgi:hypothetical protein
MCVHRRIGCYLTQSTQLWRRLSQWMHDLYSDILIFLFFLRMAISFRGLRRWYLVLGGVAEGRGFEPQSDLEFFFAEILIN